MNEPLMKCRKRMDVVKTGRVSLAQDEVQKGPVYCLSGGRHRGGVNLAQAFGWNVGTCRLNVKGESQAGSPCKSKSTNVSHRGGIARSSNEASVMEVEQRGCVIQFNLKINQIIGRNL